jgi:hypothetical protein
MPQIAHMTDNAWEYISRKAKLQRASYIQLYSVLTAFELLAWDLVCVCIYIYILCLVLLKITKNIL